jgi:hypothetical protein
MENRRTTLVAAVVLVLGGGLGACGSGPSSSAAGGAGSPTDASRATFCATFTDLGAHVTPQQAADDLGAVGTPSGIDPGARHGFEVLLDHLRRLPDDAKDADLTAMAQGLEKADRADVESFLTYYAEECQRVPTDSSS